MSLPRSPSAVAFMQFQEADCGTMCVQHLVPCLGYRTHQHDEYTLLWVLTLSAGSHWSLLHIPVLVILGLPQAGLVLCAVFWEPLSLGTVPLRSIHVVICLHSSFPFPSAKCFMVCTHHGFHHLLTVGYFPCFQFGAVANSFSAGFCVDIKCHFSAINARGTIARSYGNYVFV